MDPNELVQLLAGPTPPSSFNSALQQALQHVDFDVNRGYFGGTNILHKALRDLPLHKEALVNVETLLEFAGAIPTTEDLIVVCSRGLYGFIDMLIQHGACPYTLVNYCGRGAHTALFYAVRGKSFSRCMQHLLKHMDCDRLPQGELQAILSSCGSMDMVTDIQDNISCTRRQRKNWSTLRSGWVRAIVLQGQN